jgi:TfoX/Sxy family transcriptional regulator of competence genes
MAYDEGLAERIRGVFEGRPGVSEKRMFGGIAFLVKDRMSVGIVQDKLMVRVGPDAYEGALRERHVRKMDFTGRPLSGFVYVLPAGYEADADLQRWIERGIAFAASAPARPTGASKRATRRAAKPRRRG